MHLFQGEVIANISGNISPYCYLMKQNILSNFLTLFISVYDFGLSVCPSVYALVLLNIPQIHCNCYMFFMLITALFTIESGFIRQAV